MDPSASPRQDESRANSNVSVGQGDRSHQETSPERSARLQARALRARQRRQAETAEQRAARLERERLRRLRRRQEETPEQREARLEGDRQRRQRRREMETEEERNARMQAHAATERRRRELESRVAREARLHRYRQLRQHRLEGEEDEERYERLEAHAEAERRRRQEESQEVRDARLQEDRRRYRVRRELETDEERLARLEAHAEAERQRRDEESEEARDARLQEDRRRHRLRRELETDEERLARLEAHAEAERQRRQTQSYEERTFRLEIDRLEQQRRREVETADERAARLEAVARRAIQRRSSESADQRAIRLRDHAERRRRRQTVQVQSTGVALQSRTSPSFNLGELNRQCRHCGARHFECEIKPNHPNSFHDCCDLGRIRLDMFQNFPEVLRRLFIREGDASPQQRRLQKNFHDNIRRFNSALAMASMGAQVETLRGRGPYCYRIHGQIYHRLGPLHPREGEPRKFGQIYILDTEMAAQERLGNARNIECDPELMRMLSELLSEINPYAQSYKMMSEVERAESALALQENRRPANIRMVFEQPTARGLMERPYNLPIANEVAVVYVGEDGDVPTTRSLAVHLRQEPGQILDIRDTDKICDPLIYPLLFPTGEGGWDPTLRNLHGWRITQKEYYSHLFSIRESFNPILYSGKLFQQFAVDAYVKIEQNRLNFQRRNQLRLRAESYRGLQDYLAGEDFSGPPGRRIILSSSHLGSPRSMQQSYQDAMAIVARYGKPTYFLTVTCNPQWKEIQENLHFGQSASDRPDVVARVFHAKLQELCADLFKKHVLGIVTAYVYVVEFQKRGLPHCHMLLIMEEPWKVRTADEVDQAICAEIPNQESEPDLYTAVTSYMIHRRCGSTNPNAPCMMNGVCTKKFPKRVRERTTIDVDGYPNYRRRSLIPIVINGIPYDNEWVVPTNPYLVTKFDCHINLEICGMISAVKYLYKYIYKGPDRARINLESDRADGEEQIDEIKQHLNTRYVCAPESLHRIYGYDLQDKSHAICRLAVHLPNYQMVSFVAGQEQEYLAQAQSKYTTLTAFFELNSQCTHIFDGGHPQDFPTDARNLFYYNIPEHFVFELRSGWKPRRRGGKQIGRMYTVSPRDTERYSLRIMLLNTKGKISFEDLRTINGVLHDSFSSAAKAAGFLDDDTYFRQSLQESIAYQSAAAIRSFFACLLCFCEVLNAQELWNEFALAMADDYTNQGFDADTSVTFAYFDVLDRMARLGKDLTPIVCPPTHERPELPTYPIDFDLHERSGLQKYDTLNVEQKNAADAILAALDSPHDRCIFIDGPGGSGKTYLYNTVHDIAIGRRRKLACVAWTGIAANLLPNGRTANSLFKLNILDGNRTSTMRRQQKEARMLMETDMIIWDEISMAPKVALEAVDALLKDIMQVDAPFGGKAMVLGGDFRQVLPVVEHGQREDFVEACVHKSRLWPLFATYRLVVNMRAQEAQQNWHQFLLDVGNGDANDADDCVQIPEDMMCYDDIVTEIFGNTLNPNDVSSLRECAILAPKNVHVQHLNHDALERLNVERQEDEKIYKSVDEAQYHEGQRNHLFQQEYLNSLTPTGMPPHELRLKKGAIVMLLRNLDVGNGLCNGTRLRIEKLGRFTLACSFISGERSDQLAIIPRIDNYWDNRAPFRLRRRQFPVRVAFAMTINKAQGQSFAKVGIYLPEDVFSHGQLYVALSRSRTPSGIRVMAPTRTIRNIVYPEVLI